MPPDGGPSVPVAGAGPIRRGEACPTPNCPAYPSDLAAPLPNDCRHADSSTPHGRTRADQHTAQSPPPRYPPSHHGGPGLPGPHRPRLHIRPGRRGRRCGPRQDRRGRHRGPHADRAPTAASLVDRVPRPSCTGRRASRPTSAPPRNSRWTTTIRAARRSSWHCCGSRRETPCTGWAPSSSTPGAPATRPRSWAALLPQGLPKVILDRFDIVGVDPRGVGGSTPIRCFATKAAEIRTLAPFTATPFPGTPAQRRPWIRAARAARPGLLHHGPVSRAGDVDHAGRPRHGRPAARRGRPQADLLRRVIRLLPRAGVREPVPRPGPGDSDRRHRRPAGTGRYATPPRTCPSSTGWAPPPPATARCTNC